MDKKALTIGIILFLGLVLVIGIVSYLTFKPSPGRCGDGICDTKEKLEPNLCPRDCREIKEKKCSDSGGDICSSSQTCSGSWIEASDSDKCCNRECEIISLKQRRFGMYSAAPNGDIDEVFSILEDLNIKEISYLGPYSLINAQLDGNYDMFDEYYQKAIQNNVNIVPWIRARGTSNCDQADTNQMGSYLKSVIKKYPEIKYWKILKEPDIPCTISPRQASDNSVDPTTCLNIAIAARNTLNSECSDCKLVFGGWGPRDIDEHYDYFTSNNFYDNFDVHGLLGYHWSHLDYRPDTDKEEWIIQSSMAMARSELDDDERAIETIKLFTYFFSLGFDRIYYEQIFVFDSSSIWGTNGLITMEGTKKEIYYSLKTMVDKLEGFTTVTTISACDTPQDDRIESGPGGICYYKFNFENKNPVYVLWCDSESCSLPSEITGTVKITDYLGDEKTIDADQIILTETPIFVEEV
jgi:hypothetical protein